MRKLLLDVNDVVVNIIELDDPLKYTPPAGLRVVTPDARPAFMGLAWGTSPIVSPQTKDDLASRATDYISQLEFDVLFNQESRLRVLEAKPAITRVQYRDALIARWKVLNP